jgi:hypothetical protein
MKPLRATASMYKRNLVNLLISSNFYCKSQVHPPHTIHLHIFNMFLRPDNLPPVTIVRADTARSLSKLPLLQLYYLLIELVDNALVRSAEVQFFTYDELPDLLQKGMKEKMNELRTRDLASVWMMRPQCKPWSRNCLNGIPCAERFISQLAVAHRVAPPKTF